MTASATNLPPGVRLGVSPLSWTNEVLTHLGDDIPLETCLGEAAAAGYAGVELGRKLPGEATALRAVLAPHGLALISGWHSGLLAEHTVAEERRAVAAHAALLRDLGCAVMVYGETGHMTGPAPLDAPMSQRLRLDAASLPGYAARLDEFSRWLAGEYGLALAYHHHLMMVAETFDEVARLLEAAPAAGLLLDTGHARAAGFAYARLIDAFAGRINHIHLKDVRIDVLAGVRAGDLSFNQAVLAGLFTVPGDGGVDFGPLARFVRDTGWQGWMVVEAEQDPVQAPPAPTVARAFAHVNALFGASAH